MKHRSCFWFIGGDARQAAAAHLLAEDGNQVYAFGLGDSKLPEGVVPANSLAQLHTADYIVFPLPMVSSPGIVRTPFSQKPVALADVLDQIRPEQHLFGGRVDPQTAELFQSHGLEIWDYLSREELAVANAVPTAEGAVQLAMEQLPVTIHGTQVLVLGFGRVGKLTAQRFAALGAHVTVAARRYAQLAWAEAMGLGIRELAAPAPLSDFDLIINTIPAPVLGREVLHKLRSDCLILDLASKPGGVDFEAAKALNLNAIHALALPGKVAPVTAGAAIRDAICHIITESEREVSIGR